jgi:CRP-like cAMP-binding protein
VGFNVNEMNSDRSELKDFLRGNVIFESLTEDELAYVHEISHVQDYITDEVVFDISDEARYVFFVMEGAIQAIVNGNEYKVLGDGEVFGEIAVVNQEIRSATTLALQPSRLLKMDGNRLFDDTFVPSRVALKIMRQLSKSIAKYIVTREKSSTQALIDSGEGEFLEFKSTLRINLNIGQKDSKIERASLKTIAAFLNSKGGTLLIGVADDGKVLGLDNDRFPNDDKLLMHLTNLIKQKIGSSNLKFIDFRLVSFGDQKVLRIDCRSAFLPVYFISDDEEHFYIRTGPSTTSMQLSKMHAYIIQRFGQLAIIKS